MYLIEKLGIKSGKIERLKKKGLELSDFKRYGVVKTEGSSRGIIEWSDAFTKPFSSRELKRYYKNPESFYKYCAHNMGELFFPATTIMAKYAEGAETFRDKKEAIVSLLMTLHFFFTTCDLIYRTDIFLEIKDPKISPLGKIYEDIKEIVEKFAKKKNYDKEWVESLSSILLTSIPNYKCPYFRLLNECKTLIRKDPSLKDILQGTDQNKILSKISDRPQLYKQLKIISIKYFSCFPALIDTLTKITVNPGLVDDIESQRRQSIKKVKKVLRKMKEELTDKEFQKLKLAQEKAKWFIECQDITGLIINNAIILGFLGKDIDLVQGYFRENLNIFVKKKYKKEIKKIMKEFEKNLPYGDYYFIPPLRKLVYLLLKRNYVEDQYKRTYEKELKIWS